MGITIRSTRHSFDMPYSGFLQLRKLIAGNIMGSRILSLYLQMEELSKNKGTSEHQWNELNNELIDYLTHYPEYQSVVEFLFASDCEGKISSKDCKAIYQKVNNPPLKP